MPVLGSLPVRWRRVVGRAEAHSGARGKASVILGPMRTWGDIQMQTLNQMLTIAGGVIIAGAIGLVFSFGWGLTTVSDRYSSRWMQRFFGLLLLLATIAVSFWIVFVRTGVVSWNDAVNLFPPRRLQRP